MPATVLFDLPFAADWGYAERFFADNEGRYTKMHRLLRERHGSLDGATIVDLGLSRGQLLERFRRYEDVKLRGVEIDPAEVESARRHGLEPDRYFINVFEDTRMTAQLPYEDGQSDIVLAGEIIEHIVDTEAFLREIRRVLRPGGSLVLSTPNVLWWKYRLDVVRGRYPDLLEYRTRYGDDFGHVRVFGPDQLRALLQRAGFVDTALVGYRLGPISSLTRLPRPAARRLSAFADAKPSLTNTLIAYARRPKKRAPGGGQSTP